MNETIFQYTPDYFVQNWQANLLNLAIYVVAMVIYAVIIYKFYRMLAKKEIIKVYVEKPDKGFWKFLASVWEFILFVLQSLIIFPLITSLWFLVLGGFLMILSKSGDVGQVLLITITVIASARITSYFNEDLAKDLAKLVPFALLGVFIVDPTYFSLDATIDKFYSLPQFTPALLQYLAALVAIELVMSIWNMIWGKKEEAD